MIEEYNLSFLNLNSIKNKLLQIQTASHGLVTKGVSTYNHGMPVLMYPELTGLKNIFKQYVRIYCRKYEIPPLKFINSWFNISQPGNKLKAHRHEESIISGAFYISEKNSTHFPRNLNSTLSWIISYFLKRFSSLYRGRNRRKNYY